MAGPHVLETGVRPTVWLPPPDVQTWNIEKQGLLETPLDEKGLVDLDKLVMLGKQTVEKGYDWSSPLNDIHHLQWPRPLYRGDHVPEFAQDFRELVQRKAYIPRQFHNWLHHITLPPELPDEEVMHHSLQAELTARSLAATAQLAVRLTRNPRIPEAKLAQRLEEEFDHYMLYIENARLVPAEFQLLKLAEVEARSIDEMLAANRKLGKWALHQVPIRHRELGIAA
jgi:hypothetical protein